MLAEVRIPEAFERGAELLVALMLVGFGIWHLVRSRGINGGAVQSLVASASTRPLALGLVLGLAGSAGIALLAATTVGSRLLAVVYLGLVALGTVIGMVALTVLMSRPISWTMRREGRLRSAITVLAAMLSIGLGLAVLLRVAASGGGAMILSDRDLRQRLRDRCIVVEPLADLELQLQPASIDLRLGRQLRRAVRASEDVEELSEGVDFVLGPGEFALGTTLERVHVPNDLVARVEGRSSIGRLAILVHATAGFIDPGFEGESTLELSNLGPTPASLRIGSRI